MSREASIHCVWGGGGGGVCGCVWVRVRVGVWVCVGAGAGGWGGGGGRNATKSLYIDRENMPIIIACIMIYTQKNSRFFLKISWK